MSELKPSAWEWECLEIDHSGFADYEPEFCPECVKPHGVYVKPLYTLSDAREIIASEVEGYSEHLRDPTNRPDDSGLAGIAGNQVGATWMDRVARFIRRGPPEGER